MQQIQQICYEYITNCNHCGVRGIKFLEPAVIAGNGPFLHILHILLYYKEEYNKEVVTVKVIYCD